MYYLVEVFGLRYWAAARLVILLAAAVGAALHYIVIAPLLTAPPINQLLATGGVLFILQSFATVAFGIDFRNLGIRLPVLAFGEMHFGYSRLLSFAAALPGMLPSICSRRPPIPAPQSSPSHTPTLTHP